MCTLYSTIVLKEKAITTLLCNQIQNCSKRRFERMMLQKLKKPQSKSPNHWYPPKRSKTLSSMQHSMISTIIYTTYILSKMCATSNLYFFLKQQNWVRKKNLDQNTPFSLFFINSRSKSIPAGSNSSAFFVFRRDQRN